MRTARRLTALILGALWLLPSVAVCIVGLHLALAHHHAEHHHSEPHPAEHHHSEPDRADHDRARAGHASASDLAQVAFHGHRHDTAESDDHTHASTITPAKLPGNANATAPPISRVPVARISHPPTALSDEVSENASPPLFTAHCSLLI